MPVKFEVLGTPVGKSRPKFSTVNGHAVAYTPKKTANYETLVKLSYQQQKGIVNVMIKIQDIVFSAICLNFGI